MDKKEHADTASLRTTAIIPAAGAGIRMKTKTAKQFLDINGDPLVALTLGKFQVCPAIDCIILVVPVEEIDNCRRDIVERYRLTKVIKVIAGGDRRQDSVRMGIEATDQDCGLVVIHDGVRPFVTPSLIERAVTAARNDRAVITALPAKETVKAVDRRGMVIKTFDRKQIWLVQTPQAFRYEDIKKAHDHALVKGWEGITDDALLVEKIGIPVKVIEGSEDNIKVTTPYDLALARYLSSG